MRDLATRLEAATNDGLFHNACMTFAERNNLRVLSVYSGSSHTYPAAEVITVTFEPEKPMTVNVIE
jgi:hypothetical protein